MAGKIKDAEHKPVIIVTPSGSGQLKGTGRSTEKVDIFAMLKRHDELFIRFGGHRSACGFLMDEENFGALREALTADMEAMTEEDPGIADRDISWDIEISPGEITVELARDLERLQPFGQGNRKPVFMLKGVVPEKRQIHG